MSSEYEGYIRMNVCYVKKISHWCETCNFMSDFFIYFISCVFDVFLKEMLWIIMGFGFLKKILFYELISLWYKKIMYILWYEMRTLLIYCNYIVSCWHVYRYWNQFSCVVRNLIEMITICLLWIFFKWHLDNLMPYQLSLGVQILPYFQMSIQWSDNIRDSEVLFHLRSRIYLAP